MAKRDFTAQIDSEDFGTRKEQPEQKEPVTEQKEPKEKKAKKDSMTLEFKKVQEKEKKTARVDLLLYPSLLEKLKKTQAKCGFKHFNDFMNELLKEIYRED